MPNSKKSTSTDQTEAVVVKELDKATSTFSLHAWLRSLHLASRTTKSGVRKVAPPEQSGPTWRGNSRKRDRELRMRRPHQWPLSFLGFESGLALEFSALKCCPEQGVELHLARFRWSLGQNLEVVCRLGLLQERRPKKSSSGPCGMEELSIRVRRQKSTSSNSTAFWAAATFSPRSFGVGVSSSFIGLMSGAGIVGRGCCSRNMPSSTMAQVSCSQ